MNKSHDLDEQLLWTLIAGIKMPDEHPMLSSLFMSLAQDVCQRRIWASRPDELAVTRALLRALEVRLTLEPSLRYFSTILECRLPATELLAHASGSKN